MPKPPRAFASLRLTILSRGGWESSKSGWLFRNVVIRLVAVFKRFHGLETKTCPFRNLPARRQR